MYIFEITYENEFYIYERNEYEIRCQSIERKSTIETHILITLKINLL